MLAAGTYRLRLGVAAEEWFEWKSGIRAPVYTDCRLLPNYPGESAIVSAALGSSIRASFPDAQYIIGMESAGIPWAALAGRELGLPFAWVRKEKKGYGASSGLVECSPPHGVKAVVIDDLVASGKSLLHAITALREECDITTIGIQSIVNWDFPKMHDTFRSLDISIRALVSYPHMLTAALEAGLITRAAMAELTEFYKHPKEHEWNMDALAAPASSPSASTAS